MVFTPDITPRPVKVAATPVPCFAGTLERLVVTCTAVLVLLCVAAVSAGAAPPLTFAPGGERGGEVSGPVGVAVDQSNGNTYVSDDHRIDEFDSSGHFLRAFGRGVVGAGSDSQSPANQVEGLTVAATGGLYTDRKSVV
jgi:hypothetical protein